MDSDKRDLQLSALPDAGKINFLSLLAHNLTVAARASYPGQVEETEVAERLRAFNEIQHTVTGQLLKLLANDARRYPDEDFINIISERARDAGCESDLNWAVDFSLKYVRK
jgi:hypothetical protein